MGSDPLNGGERLAGNIGNENFPLIARICNILSEGKRIKPNLIHSRLTHRSQISRPHKQQLYGEGTFYATGRDVWDWVKEPWAGSIQKIKRSNTPDVYKDLWTGITKSEGPVFEELELVKIFQSKCRMSKCRTPGTRSWETFLATRAIPSLRAQLVGGFMACGMIAVG